MFHLPTEIQNTILDFLSEIDDYRYQEFWKKYFNISILSKLNLKDYYKKYILSEIDQGYRLVAKRIDPCYDCFENGHLEPRINCQNCQKLYPCLNCYWYNPIELYSCYCQNDLYHISWKDIKPFIKNGNKYERYIDFIRSKEWKDLLERHEQDQYQMQFYINN